MYNILFNFSYPKTLLNLHFLAFPEKTDRGQGGHFLPLLEEGKISDLLKVPPSHTEVQSLIPVFFCKGLLVLSSETIA